MEGLSLITKILVGVDGSENSEKALNYALEIADKFSASILILNVFQPPPDHGYQPNMLNQSVDYQSNSVSFIEDLRTVHEAVLSRAIEKATKLKPNLKINIELKEGDSSRQIVETAANGEFDLIVIGHRGNSKINEILLGSTSEKVIHNARCAVLITN